MWHSPVLDFFVSNVPPLSVIMTAGPCGLAWAYACLFFAGYLKQEKSVKTGYTRKIFHILIFMSVAIVQRVWGTPAVCLFGGMTTLVIFYAVMRGDGHLLYEALAREKDAPRQTLYIITPYFATLLGGIISTILFGDIALFGYLITGLGDAIGEPVGTRFGHHPYEVPSWGGVRAVRTYEGSAAVFVASAGAILAGLTAFPDASIPMPLSAFVPLSAVGCALLEAVSPHGWDNATMQIVPTWIISMAGVA